MSLIKYAISNITSFTTRPMHLILYCGFAVLIMGIVLSIITLVQKFTGSSIGGFTTVIILICFTSSVIMLSVGVIGYYIAKIYEEVKKEDLGILFLPRQMLITDIIRKIKKKPVRAISSTLTVI